jgi:hypothetical protein
MASFTLETTDSGQTRQFEFNAPSVAIGRDRGADFTLDHPTVSRQHAVVSWDGQQYRLVILSRGGLTAVDGQQVGGEVPLHDGCHLMFGQLQFVFRSEFAAARPPTAQPYAEPQYAPQTGAQQPVYSQSAFPTASTTGMHQSPHAPGLYQAPTHVPGPGETADFAAWSPSGSFPVPGQPSGAQPVPPQAHAAPAQAQSHPPGADGLMTWDEIAATADSAVEQRDAMTDFHRMQKEQELADGQRGGFGPGKAIIAILVIGVAALAVIYGGAEIGPRQQTGTTTGPSDDPKITWRKGDINCVGAADCRELALEAFELGRQTLERQEADIINLYEGYKQLERATALIEKARSKTPTQMETLDDLKLRAAAEMKTFYLSNRAHYFSKKDQKDGAKMADALRKMQAYFPDDRLNYHRWALKQVRQMKNDGLYPTEHIY